MQPIPDNVLSQFNAVLDKKVYPSSLHADYRKWLRYFLDYCSKYDPPGNRSELVRVFITKIRSKGASGNDLHQAAHAVSLFFAMGAKYGNGTTCSGAEDSRNDASATELVADNSGSSGQRMPVDTAKEPVAPAAKPQPSPRSRKRYNEWWSMERTPSPQWDEIVIEKLAGEIKARHYSRKTLKAYADWSRKFQLYLKHKLPQDVTADDVKSYLTYLAVNCRVSASTQNQAFNA